MGGRIQTESSVVLESALARQVLPQMLIGDGVPLQFDVAATVTASLFGASVTPTIRLNCGMMLASAKDMLMHLGGPVMGPMSCADPGHLAIPDIDAKDDHKLEKYLALAENVKNVVAIVFAFLGFTLGPFFVFRVCWPRRGFCCCCRRSQKKQQIREVVAAKGMDEHAQSAGKVTEVAAIER